MKDKNQHFIEDIKHPLNLENTGLTPGQMLGISRQVNNISSDEFCRFMDISPKRLSDIENNRAPFPTMLLLFIFIHGFRSWYFGDNKE